MNVVCVRDDEILEIARHFVESNSTVRKVAKDLDISKSTVYYRLQQFVSSPHAKEEDRKLAVEVIALLKKNKEERHIRGGLKTQKVFLMRKQVNN